MSMPRSHIYTGHNGYDIYTGCSRTAKRAIPHGEEKNKEERRRRFLLPNNGGRQTARPSSLPVTTLPITTNNGHTIN